MFKKHNDNYYNICYICGKQIGGGNLLHLFQHVASHVINSYRKMDWEQFTSAWKFYNSDLFENLSMNSERNVLNTFTNLPDNMPLRHFYLKAKYLITSTILPFRLPSNFMPVEEEHLYNELISKDPNFKLTQIDKQRTINKSWNNLTTTTFDDQYPTSYTNNFNEQVITIENNFATTTFNYQYPTSFTDLEDCLNAFNSPISFNKFTNIDSPSNSNTLPVTNLTTANIAIFDPNLNTIPVTRLKCCTIKKSWHYVDDLTYLASITLPPPTIYPKIANFYVMQCTYNKNYTALKVAEAAFKSICTICKSVIHIGENIVCICHVQWHLVHLLCKNNVQCELCD